MDEPTGQPRRRGAKRKSSAVGGPEKRFSAELAAQPRLVVRVLGARGLGSADVVARVWCARLDDVHDADAEPQETLPCRGGDAPAWETHNEFCFALKLDAPEDVQGGCCAVALRDDAVARDTGYADGDAALGVAVVPLRMIFERGKAMAGTKTVHLTATWLPLGAAERRAQARGEVLASFFFAEGLSRAAFETSVARILGRPEEYDDDELASPPAAWPPRDAAARRAGPALLRRRAARSRARSSADFSGASSARYVAMKRLQKAARSAEASLLQAGTPSKISSGHRALRDRLRDGLAALRERDSRHAARASSGASSRPWRARATPAARGAPEESSHLPVDVLVAPFTLVLARPRARGRRSVANCFAAVLEGRPGPVPVWLDAAPASKHVGAAPPAAVLDDLRRRAASRGVALPVAATLLRDGTGAVLHCENDDAALDLRATLAQDEALPPGWALDGAMEAGRSTVEEAMAAGVRARRRARGRAARVVGRRVVQAPPGRARALLPRGARLLQLRSDAQALGRADAAANAAFDPRLLARADGAYVEALDAAAPALARHAARCVEAEATTAEALAWRDKAAALDLVEAPRRTTARRPPRRSSSARSSAPATARGTTASSTSATPRSGRSSRSKRCARRRDAARGARPSRRGVNALLGAKLPVSAVGLPRHDDAASARTLLYFAARAFSRSDVFPRPLLAWLAKDPRATCRAVRDDANQRVDLHHALRSLAVEPTQRGITASALLYALEDDSRRHEKVLVREAYAFGSDVEPPFP
ncbi:hypothetical protein JL720_1024 [Aureococcus anophagefferens]|nr:hypothetical protein JL720_1024 [Aureococcus anophagefferens]